MKDFIILTEDMKAWNRSYRFFPITESSRINTSAGLIAWVLMALAALTLFVASMNYVLISISTLVSRSKTIAMLKVGVPSSTSSAFSVPRPPY